MLAEWCGSQSRRKKTRTLIEIRYSQSNSRGNICNLATGDNFFSITFAARPQEAIRVRLFSQTSSANLNIQNVLVSQFELCEFSKQESILKWQVTRKEQERSILLVWFLRVLNKSTWYLGSKYLSAVFQWLSKEILRTSLLRIDSKTFLIQRKGICQHYLTFQSELLPP